jgi:hypothetical protein
VLRKAERHLDRATHELQHYKKVCEESRKSIEEFFDGLPESGAPPCSHDVQLHLSFDFAQQVGSSLK